MKTCFTGGSIPPIGKQSLIRRKKNFAGLIYNFNVVNNVRQQWTIVGRKIMDQRFSLRTKKPYAPFGSDPFSVAAVDFNRRDRFITQQKPPFKERFYGILCF